MVVVNLNDVVLFLVFNDDIGECLVDIDIVFL